MKAQQGISAVAALIGVIVIGAVAIVLWYAMSPGPMAFVTAPRVKLSEYAGAPTGVPADLPGRDDPLVRGRYLTQAADCEACHTTPGGKPFAGGRAFATPFGTLYSPNITSDPETGIGHWTDAQFIKAVHKGVRPDGARLYPAFPYASYTYLTDDDVLAIKQYLASLPAVRQNAPANDLAFPFDQRWLMALWSAFFNPDQRFRATPAHSPEWNRGAYLVEGLGHCGECHTPRNLLQALDNRQKFAGAVADGWRAYNITPDKSTGVGAWSDVDLASYLAAGHAKERGAAAGPMREAVEFGLRHLTPSDIGAMVTYLRSVPPLSSSNLPSRLAGPAPAAYDGGNAAHVDARGRMIFESACVSCHAWTGEGTATSYATLTGSRAVNDPSGRNVVQVILSGVPPLRGQPDVFMPSFGHAYTDAEIAAVANYVTARFGAEASTLSANQVARLRNGG
ncbi:cytochrome c [Povalibacter sp.]|uniref:cytochrome c n=1 Tax=Povalibacter sp. TaxID=1962978 RepID=UPI002F404680